MVSRPHCSMWVYHTVPFRVVQSSNHRSTTLYSKLSTQTPPYHEDNCLVTIDLGVRSIDSEQSTYSVTSYKWSGATHILDVWSWLVQKPAWCSPRFNCHQTFFFVRRRSLGMKLQGRLMQTQVLHILLTSFSWSCVRTEGTSAQVAGGERPRKLNWLKMVALWFRGFGTYECV